MVRSTCQTFICLRLYIYITLINGAFDMSNIYLFKIIYTNVYITLINGAFDMSNIYLFKIIYIYNTYQWCVRHVKHLFV